MEGRQEEVGRSEGLPVMGRIGPETASPGNAGLILRPKAGADVRLVSHGENIMGTFTDGKANDGFGWCTRPPRR